MEADLAKKYSPEQIAGRLKVDFPDQPELEVSTETIYQSLYVRSRGALKRDLTRYLCTGRAVRRPSRKVGQRKNRIPNMINIAERPAEADDRAVPGHWESSRHNTAMSRWHRVCVRLGQNCGKGCRVAAPTQLVRRSQDQQRWGIRRQGIGLQIRAGLHTGEVELRDGDVGGIGVHIAARIVAAAGAGEILTSRTVRDLVVVLRHCRGGSGNTCFEGQHDTWQLFKITRP
jgi:hypothetical protein